MAKFKAKIAVDRLYLIASSVMAIVLVVASISLIVFLSNNLIKAFSAGDLNEEHIEFNLEGYQQVITQLRGETTQ